MFPESRTPLNTLFENNIFYFEGQGKWGKNAQGINTQFRNNLYFNIAPHESETNPITDNPKFSNPGRSGTNIDLTTMKALSGYQLKPGSIGLGAGVFIKDNGEQDILKVKSTDGKTNIGALGAAN